LFTRSKKISPHESKAFRHAEPEPRPGSIRTLSASLLSISGSDDTVSGARAARNLAQVKFGGPFLEIKGFAVFS
jgi:hypothetical protein